MTQVGNDGMIFQRAIASFQAGMLDDAERSFKAFLKSQPRHVAALNLLGVLLTQLKKYDEAERYLRLALKENATSDATFYNYGIVLKALKRPTEALQRFREALAINPKIAETWNNRGTVFNDLKRHDDALRDFDQAILLKPNYQDAFYNKGNSLSELKRYDEAFAAYDKALAINPGMEEAWLGRGKVFHELRRHDEAFAAYDRALTLKPDLAEALYCRGAVFSDLKRHEEAFASYDKAFALKPDQKYLEGVRLHTKMHLCDWADFGSDCTQLISAVQTGHPASTPFAILAIPSSASDHLQCARTFAREEIPAAAAPLWQGERYAHDRIRVAYVSADFDGHAVSHLLAGLFERHDRARFETIAISLGADDRSAMRTRLKGTFERFIDVRDKSDLDVARLMRALEVDVAIDLMGFTANCRPTILAHRPAPIQVNYLGFSGTMGADHVDYIIGDRCVISEHQRPQFSEHVVYLPETFFGYDNKQKISARTPARAEQGLPDVGFVFCAFNNTYKLTPQLFDIWMLLLRAVEGSVLWLSQANDAAVRNLRREAEARGIDAARLIFAPRLQRMEDHLARDRLGDLFLDTLPYNAHTTASDALWAGLPVLTCRGETFAGRVAASLLNAVGLPELVTDNLADYEALALKLAREPVLLGEIRAKLARNRDTHPLFDTARFARHIEAAYTTMWEISQRGAAPRSFSVEPI